MQTLLALLITFAADTPQPAALHVGAVYQISAAAQLYRVIDAAPVATLEPKAYFAAVASFTVDAQVWHAVDVTGADGKVKAYFVTGEQAQSARLIPTSKADTAARAEEAIGRKIQPYGTMQSRSLDGRGFPSWMKKARPSNFPIEPRLDPDTGEELPPY
jgi:hypothetical protein